MTLPCSHAEALLFTSLDETLDATSSEALESHLAACPACVRTMTDGIVVRNALREVGSIEADEAVPPLSADLQARLVAAMARGADASERTATRRLA